MSVHDAISCDACMKSNFSGNRYKCLICYDYDLCASCYESGATSAQHLTQHPMQCVLARADCDLYYAEEEQSKIYLPHSFTCPFCGRIGFSDTTLNTHVNSEHAEDCFEVVCPICAATPGGDPNRVTEDFIGHLMVEHRSFARDFDETQAVMAAAAAAEHQMTHHVIGSGVRGISRMHRDAYQYHSPSSTISSLSPSGGGQENETIESMSELLYQLTAIKGRSSTIQSISSQLQQLELQLQTTRHQLEGLPIRQSHQAASRHLQQQHQGPGDGSQIVMLTQGIPLSASVGLSTNISVQTPKLKSHVNQQYLLSRLDDSAISEADQERAEAEIADKALFVQELLMTALVEDLTSKTSVTKQSEMSTNLTESAVLKYNSLVLSSGHQMNNSCDRKPVPTTHKEIVARDVTLAHGGVVTSHQSLDRMEMHPQKTRLHPPQKITKHKSGKEPLPPKK